MHDASKSRCIVRETPHFPKEFGSRRDEYAIRPVATQDYASHCMAASGWRSLFWMVGDTGFEPVTSAV